MCTGYIVFAIGFADADYGELVSIASKPSERHVFFVDDLDAFKKIEEKLITFVCEAATASKSIYIIYILYMCVYIYGNFNPSKCSNVCIYIYILGPGKLTHFCCINALFT